MYKSNSLAQRLCIFHWSQTVSTHTRQLQVCVSITQGVFLYGVFPGEIFPASSFSRLSRRLENVRPVFSSSIGVRSPRNIVYARHVAGTGETWCATAAAVAVEPLENTWCIAPRRTVFTVRNHRPRLQYPIPSVNARFPQRSWKTLRQRPTTELIRPVKLGFKEN